MEGLYYLGIVFLSWLFIHLGLEIVNLFTPSGMPTMKNPPKPPSKK